MTRSMHAQRPRAAASAAAAVADRVAALDWATMAADLDGHGCALTGPLLDADECAALAAAYPSDDLFRSRVRGSILARRVFELPHNLPVPAVFGALYCLLEKSAGAGLIVV